MALIECIVEFCLGEIDKLITGQLEFVFCRCCSGDGGGARRPRSPQQIDFNWVCHRHRRSIFSKTRQVQLDDVVAVNHGAAIFAVGVRDAEIVLAAELLVDCSGHFSGELCAGVCARSNADRLRCRTIYCNREHILAPVGGI